MTFHSLKDPRVQLSGRNDQVFRLIFSSLSAPALAVDTLLLSNFLTKKCNLSHYENC